MINLRGKTQSLIPPQVEKTAGKTTTICASHGKDHNSRGTQPNGAGQQDDKDTTQAICRAMESCGLAKDVVLQNKKVCWLPGTMVCNKSYGCVYQGTAVRTLYVPPSADIRTVVMLIYILNVSYISGHTGSIQRDGRKRCFCGVVGDATHRPTQPWVPTGLRRRQHRPAPGCHVVGSSVLNGCVDGEAWYRGSSHNDCSRYGWHQLASTLTKLY